MWHPMSSRSSEVHIDDDNSDKDGDNVQDEREQQILGHQRDCGRCWGKDLGDEQQEDDDGEKYGDRQGDLFS